MHVPLPDVSSPTIVSSVWNFTDRCKLERNCPAEEIKFLSVALLPPRAESEPDGVPGELLVDIMPPRR